MRLIRATSSTQVDGLVGIASVVAALSIWQILANLRYLDPLSFPSTIAIVGAFGNLVRSTNLWSSIADTLLSWSVGLGISVLLMVPAGFVLGMNEWLFRSFRLVIELLKPLPSITLLPLALLLFGPTLRMKLVLICIGTMWPLLLQVIYGVQDADPMLLDTARAYRLTPIERLRFVRLPSAAPFIATGLRFAATDALILSIMAELVGGGNGLGLSLSLAEYAAALPQMYALIIVIGLLGLVINNVFARLERHALRWHQSQRVAPV